MNLLSRCQSGISSHVTVLDAGISCVLSEAVWSVSAVGTSRRLSSEPDIVPGYFRLLRKMAIERQVEMSQVC
jgi:hypothetical protein